MKKKQLTSILLAGIMILGLCVPAFADNTPNINNEGTGGQSTNVEYTALNNESYLLTVPASLAPGGSDTVKLEGNWPSTRTMKATADANVVLTNSINSTDKKILTISFNEIALAGNNNETVSATGEVSVQEITNANFGEWSGRFSYYVNGEGTGVGPGPGTGTGPDNPITLLEPTMAAGNTWYKSTQRMWDITSIKFVDSYIPTGSEDETWFADKDNGTVPETQITAYRTGTEVIVAGNGSGKIMANENSSYMFSDINSSQERFGELKSLDVSILDTSKVTNMNRMFSGCYALTSLDLSSFNTSNVTNMSNMFVSCKALTSLNVSNFNTSNVTNMGCMFSNCETLISLDLSSFDTSNVTDMSNMFYYCKALTSLNVFNFDTSKVINMNEIFRYCEALASLDLSNFDTSNVIDMGYMFGSCWHLASLNISNFNTSRVTDMEGMFNDCTFLASLDLSNFNTSKITSMYRMFGGCGRLTSLNVSNFDTSKVTNMNEMFEFCKILTSIYVGSGWNTDAVTNSTDMFNKCTKLPNYNSSVIDKTNAHTGPDGYLTLKT